MEWEGAPFVGAHISWASARHGPSILHMMRSHSTVIALWLPCCSWQCGKAGDSLPRENKNRGTTMMGWDGTVFRFPLHTFRLDQNRTGLFRPIRASSSSKLPIVTIETAPALSLYGAGELRWHGWNFLWHYSGNPALIRAREFAWHGG